MLEYKNIKRLDGISDEDYFKINAWSHSKLKLMFGGIKEDFIETDKVRLGKLVDKLRTGFVIDAEDLDNPQYEQANKISQQLHLTFGDIIKNLTPQVAYECDIQLQDFNLHCTGKLDWQLGNHAVFDLKVNNDCKSVDDCEKLIEWMGYDNQLYNYGRMAKVKHHYLMFYLVKIKKAILLKRLDNTVAIEKAENWWRKKVFEYGEIL